MTLVDSLGQSHKPKDAVGSFLLRARELGVSLASDIQTDFWEAPHTPKPLPHGRRAVYVFGMAKTGRVIKVGKAGPKSNARYQSQHYGFSAPSTVAKAIAHNPIIWPLLNIASLSEDQTGDWIRQNTFRWNFLLAGEDEFAASQLETYLRALLAPMLEGVDTKKK